MDAAAARPAGLARRLAASGYEGLLLTALLIGVGFALLPLVTPAANPAGAGPSLYAISPWGRRLSAAAIFAACGFYCTWFWSGERRSLPMKTWRLALRAATGGPVGLSSATLRYLACWVGPTLAIAGYQALQPLGHGRWAWPLLAFNYAWALIDREGQFLQDRVAGTRLDASGPG
jgi:uncharacterized RDD family membrane protein YckC